MKLFTLITGTVAVGLSMLLANVQVNAAPQPKTKLRPTKTVLPVSYTHLTLPTN